MTYIVQTSGDLANWSDVCTASGVATATGGGFLSETGTGYLRIVTARDVVESRQRFMRIVVRRN
jgi:hypothetical protein